MFDIRKSNKAYINHPEHYIVTHNGFVLLRAMGHEGRYEVSTATSGEDSGLFCAYKDEKALIEAANSVCQQLGGTPTHRLDVNNKLYCYIGNCEYLSDLHRIAELLVDKLTSVSELEVK